jgi:hypothetical protein
MSQQEPSANSVLLIAAAHPADTRLVIAVAVFVVFVWLLPRPAPRPLSAAALCVIVAAWDFGATLIWGTGGATKLRFAFAFSPVGGPALLACAIIGIIAAACALRSFAHAERRTGTLLAGAFAVAFAAWSATVRYSPIIAVLGLFTGSIALWWAATMPADEQPTQLDAPPVARLARWARLRVLASVGLVLMSGPVFYAWLRWGPKSWVDPACGASLVLPAFIMSVAIPALAVGFTSRAAGRRTEAVAAAAVITILVAAAICVVAFLLWFGQNNCGE